MFKKFLNMVTHRLFIIIVMLLVQITFLTVVVIKFEESFLLLYFISQAIGFLLLLKIINSRINPSYKMVWMFIILLVPIFGTLSYLIFGNTNKRVDKRIKVLEEKIGKNLSQDKYVMDNIKLEDMDAYNQFNYLLNAAKYPVYENQKIKYLKDGETYYEELINELKKAEKYIFLEYFIIDEGIMWNSVLEILKEKVKNGVDVRLIYDDMGCIISLPSKYYKTLNEIGIKCVSFNRFVPILNARLNNRDHKKIVVIDGNVAFTGGINLADEYINAKERFGHWKDNGLLIRGSSVWSFTVMFLSTWNYMSKEKDDYDNYKVDNIDTKEIGYITPYSDSPLDNETVGKSVYLNLINKAKKYIYITTPYLIIDNELEYALVSAAKSGIEIKIIVPGIPDKKIVNEVTKAYYHLINEDIKIYEYNGFIHAKTFIVDDIYASVGTINLDYRSLYLHFECGTLMYRCNCIKDIKTDYLNTIKESKEIKNLKTSLFTNFKRAILKLFAPLM